MTEMLRHIDKKPGLIGLGLIGFMSLAGLVGCSDDLETVTDAVTVNIEAQTCSSAFVEEGQDSESRDDSPLTRAWTLPSGFFTFAETFGADGLFKDQKDMVNKSIDVFFTQDGTDTQEGILYYNEVSGTWNLNNKDVKGSSTPYQLYGYIPKEDAEGATITANGTFSNGAVLKINGLNTVTPSDVCVIVGAKDGNDDGNNYNEASPYTVTGLSTGKFDVKFNSGDGAKNYIFLLFDHLYSSLRFSFKVADTYYALRTIKLKKLELIAYANESGGGVRAKYNATITLRKNDAGTSPIVGTVTFTADNSSAYVAPTPLYEGDGLKLTNTTSEFLGCFVPGVNTYFKLRSTYDVYDKNVTATNPDGNLIRQNCQAENTIDLRAKFETSSSMRGHCYKYEITVQPTYLYVLSDPDLDNPTLRIEN